MAELVVRMGEIAATQHVGDVLVGLGLGSCIGLVLIEDRGPVAAMAHVVLPESNGTVVVPGKFADTAVPQLHPRGDLDRGHPLAALRRARRRRADVRDGRPARHRQPQRARGARGARTPRGSPCAPPSPAGAPAARCASTSRPARSRARRRGARRSRSRPGAGSRRWRGRHERRPLERSGRRARRGRRSRATDRGASRRPSAAPGACATSTSRVRASSPQDQQRRLERAHESFCRTAGQRLSTELLTPDRARGPGPRPAHVVDRDQPDPAAVDLRDDRVPGRWARRC